MSASGGLSDRLREGNQSQKRSVFFHFCKISPRFQCAAVGLAEGISSQNIVGYNTIDVNKMYTLLTVNFQNMSGGALKINDAFPYADGMTTGKTYTSADNIQVMTADGNYEIYFLSNGDYGKSGHKVELENKWAKMGTSVVSEDTLPVGATFWYLSRAGQSTPHKITTAGAVDLAESESYEINKAYTLIGSPFPVEIPLNGGIEVTGATTGKTYTSADNIQVMTADGNYDIYFLSNGDYGKSGHKAELENKWAKMGTSVVSEDKLPVGGGAWYLSRSQNGTLKFLNPIGK